MSANGERAFRRPADTVKQLAAVVESARRAAFWRRKLSGAPIIIRSLADFEALPITPAAEYRRQPFGDVLADPAGAGWIPGPALGQSPRRVAVAEGADEARVRIIALTRALTLAVQPAGAARRATSTALVASTAAGRYFGAEMCAALIRMGTPAHLITDAGNGDLAAVVRRLRPEVLAALTPALDLADLPRSVSGVITPLGGGAAASGAERRVEILVQNELGALGCALNGGALAMNADLFHFETSANGALVATPYFSRVQPIVRLDTGL